MRLPDELKFALFQTEPPLSLDLSLSWSLFVFLFWQILGIAEILSNFGEGKLSNVSPAPAGQQQYALPYSNLTCFF